MEDCEKINPMATSQPPAPPCELPAPIEAYALVDAISSPYYGFLAIRRPHDEHLEHGVKCIMQSGLVPVLALGPKEYSAALLELSEEFLDYLASHDWQVNFCTFRQEFVTQVDRALCTVDFRLVTPATQHSIQLGLEFMAFKTNGKVA